MPAHGLLEARQAAITVSTETDYVTYSTYSSTYSDIYTSYPVTFTVFPLTTVFSQPASCNAPVFTVATDQYALTQNPYANDLQYDSYYALSYETVMYRAFHENCYPPNYPSPSVVPYTAPIGGTSVTVSPSTVYPSSVYYSPGLCPAGWTSSTSSVAGADTVATCCPSGYTASGDVYGDCARTSGTTITIVNGTSTSIVPVSTIVVSSIAVRYQASDLPVLNAAATATQSHTGTGAATSSPTPTGVTATSTSSPGGGGLSTGAQAGIGVGVSLGVLAIAGALAAFLLMRRKKRRSTPPAYSSVGQERKSMREVDQNHRGYEIQT